MAVFKVFFGNYIHANNSKCNLKNKLQIEILSAAVFLHSFEDGLPKGITKLACLSIILF